MQIYEGGIEDVFDVERVVEVPGEFGEGGERRLILAPEDAGGVGQPLLALRSRRDPLAQALEKRVRDVVDVRIGRSRHLKVHRLIDALRHRRQPVFEEQERRILVRWQHLLSTTITTTLDLFFLYY